MGRTVLGHHRNGPLWSSCPIYRFQQRRRPTSPLYRSHPRAVQARMGGEGAGETNGKGKSTQLMVLEVRRWRMDELATNQRRLI